MKAIVSTIEFSGKRLLVRAERGSGRSVSRELVQPLVRPVVKWAGGKQWLASAAPHLIPDSFAGRYYEPFLGGAAFFFALEPAVATLSDRNNDLITTYRALRDDAEAVIRLLAGYPHDKDFYYAMRSRVPRSMPAIAARFLYLNRTCWNGLYRVNQKGKFNTPFGRFKNPTICDPARLRQAGRLLRRANLRTGDFQTIAEEARAGDLVYFDPPYITGHQNNGFLKYNSPLFSWEDQERLARVAMKLANSGVFVLASNADQMAVVNLYKGFNRYQLARKSLIGGETASRREVHEVLLSNYPIVGCGVEIT